MGNKNGTLFSKSLFGYRRKDVVEYIRNVDVSHADEISRINYEKDVLQDKLLNFEKLAKTLEQQLEEERKVFQERIKKISFEYEKKISELTNLINNQKDKLSDSETRASSYLKLVDSSSLRAETAEAELAVLSAAIEDCKNEINDLRAKLSDKEVELKRASEFEVLAKKILENNNHKKQADLSSILSIFKKSRNNR